MAERMYVDDEPYSSPCEEINNDGYVLLDDSLEAPWDGDQTRYRPAPPLDPVRRIYQQLKGGLNREALESLKEAVVARFGASVDRALLERSMAFLGSKLQGAIVGEASTQQSRLAVPRAAKVDDDESFDPTVAFLSERTKTEPATRVHSFLRSLPSLVAHSRGPDKFPSKLLDGVTKLFGAPDLAAMDAESDAQDLELGEFAAGADALEDSVDGLGFTGDEGRFDTLGVSTTFKRESKTESERMRRQRLLSTWSEEEEMSDGERNGCRGRRPGQMVSPNTMLKDL